MSSKTFQDIAAFETKPHIAILTDICNEPDDAESLTRYLLYANEFHTDAIIATTSVWQQKETHGEQIHHIINAYAAVEDNLNAHVPPSRRYPTADSLRAVTREGIKGYGMQAATAQGPISEGTKLLVKAVDAIPAEGHIWVLHWGGANVLAQALLEVQRSRSPEELTKFSAKLRVYAISDQDDAGAWVRLHFPQIFYIASVHAWNMYGLAAWSGISGEKYYGFDEGGPDSELVSKEWLKKHIQIGKYGAEAYPDPVFIMEGDTPTYLGLIQNGLGDLEHPEWGGWGGRYSTTDSMGITRHYSDTADKVVGKDGKMHHSNQATIWRWRDAYQWDFAARMQWTLSPDFKGANHAPVVVLNGDSGLKPLHIKVGFGATVTLDASESWDPDGDKLEFKWTHYQEPSITQWTAAFQVPDLEFVDQAAKDGRPFEKVSINIPGREAGLAHPLHPERIIPWGEKTYHFILEVVDNANFRMRSYRRVLVEVVDMKKHRAG